MPTVPIYAHRLVEGIANLERFPDDLVDRRAVEEALGVGKWTAWRIMRRCGALDGPGNTLVCRRGELIDALRRLLEDGRIGPEVRRRQRVENYLEGIATYASRRQKEIARGSEAETLMRTRVEHLPAGVDLGRTELRITYDGMADFLQKFGAVVYALSNDLEQIQEFIDNPR